MARRAAIHAGLSAPPPRGAAAGWRIWLRRFGWLLVLYTGGVAALAVVAIVLHLAMRAAGMR